MELTGWQQLWELYEHAGALPESEWQCYLERSTTDPNLRLRVLGMLRDPNSSMSEQPRAVEPETGLDRTGTVVGRYRVERRIGLGGMGEVYAAADEELDRPVALKFVASSRAGTLGVSLQDVMREAKAASALNHPHIVTVHEVIPFGSSLVIVMEKISGVSMRTLCGSPMPAAQAVPYVQQAALALAAAHAAGIVHRDVKPENLMVRTDGYVKLLDFGLAKTVEAAANSGGPVPAGTLRYMSPEQVRGDTLTPASDVFSLGVLLYELLTGKHPFTAPSLLQTMQAIATSDPPLLARDTPAELSELMRRMLKKEPRLRPRADEVADRLAGLSGQAKGPRRRTLVLAAAAAAAGTSAAGLWYAFKTVLKSHGPSLNVTALASLPGSESQPAFSPDGRQIAFVFRADREWNSHVYRKVLEGGPVTRLTAEEGSESDPVWSPDGKQIAFLRVGAGRRQVMVIPETGRTASLVGEIAEQEHAFRMICWQPDSRGLVVSDTASHSTQDLALYSLDVGTGVRRRLTDPPRGKSDVIPTYPPDGEKLAFCRIGENGQGDVFVMPTSGGPAKQLTSDNKTLTGLAWTVDGHALIRVSNRDGSYRLWRQLAEPGGQPERVEGLEGSVYDVAVGGNRLAYRGASFIDVNIWRYGAPPTTAPGVPLIASADLENDARYSPDGSRIAFASARSEGRAQIWSCGGDGSNPRQLTSFGPDHGTTGSPAWSPDGKLIAFDTRPPGSSSSIFVIDADGGGQPRRLTGPGSTNFIPAWSSDGRFIYFGSDRSGPVEIWRLPVSGGTPEQVTRQGGFEVFLTADGRFLYYTKGHEREGMWRMPIEGGEEEFLPELKPVARHRYWHGARDGIYFLDFSDSVPVPTIRLFRFSGRKVTTVLTAPAPPVPRFRGLTFTPDGRSFLYMQYDVRRSAVMLVNGFR